MANAPHCFFIVCSTASTHLRNWVKDPTWQFVKIFKSRAQIRSLKTISEVQHKSVRQLQKILGKVKALQHSKLMRSQGRFIESAGGVKLYEWEVKSVKDVNETKQGKEVQMAADAASPARNLEWDHARSHLHNVSVIDRITQWVEAINQTFYTHSH